MSVTLTGTGGCFTRLGQIIKNLRNLNGYRGDTAPVGNVDDTGATWGASGPTVVATKAMFDNIGAQYQSTLQNLTDGLYAQKTSYRSAQNSLATYLKNLAQTTVIEMVHADAVLPSKTLSLAMTELIRQMKASGSYVTPNVVSATVTAGSANVGNATVTCSVIGPDGKTREYSFPETLDATVTTDSLTGGTAGSESITVVGELAESDTLNYNWPDGSSASASLTVTNPALDAQTSGNVLTNSDLESWTSNVPDSWSILVGTAGTTILKNVSVLYGSVSTAALEFVGDAGATLSSIVQTVTLTPSTVYAFNCRIKKSASLLAGVIEISLVDASNATISDDASTANATTVAFGTITTSYAAFSGFIRTPTNLPSTTKIRVRVSTALTNGQSVYIDDLALVKATPLYTGGPYLAAFRGSTDVLKNDTFAIAVSNNVAGLFQTAAEQLFSMRSLGLQLPSSGSSLINNSLCQ